MGRTKVKAAESIGIDAFLHDDDFAFLIKNNYSSADKVRPAVKQVFDDAGITVDPKALEDIVVKIALVGEGWQRLEDLENATGRKGMG